MIVPSIRIGESVIGAGMPCFIIAEAGSNHNGEFELALKLIDVAVEAGADAVKFQTFTAEKIAARTESSIAKLAGSGFEKTGTTLFELYKKCEMPREWLEKLSKYCKKKKIVFLSTPFDNEAVDVLDGLNVPCFKIASFELVDIPLLKYVAKKNKPIILSTGMATLGEIEDAVSAIKNEGNDQIALLHCGIEYPPRWEDVHLLAMDTMKKAFPYPIGYSDHTLGITVPIAAVARGACIIEKHFTVDNSLVGPDHKFALNPQQLRTMVDEIRHTELCLGSFEKKPVEREMIHRRRGRRSLFACTNIFSGTVITSDMLAVLRPGIGLMPKFLEVVVGRLAKRDIPAHSPITWDDI